MLEDKRVGKWDVLGYGARDLPVATQLRLCSLSEPLFPFLLFPGWASCLPPRTLRNVKGEKVHQRQQKYVPIIKAYKKKKRENGGKEWEVKHRLLVEHRFWN